MGRQKTTLSIQMVFERIALWALGFVLFLRLLIYRIFEVSQREPWAEVCRAADLADAVIILLILAAFVIFFIKSVLNKESFPRTAIDIPILVFLAISSASLFYSLDKQSTATAIVTLFANIAFFYTLTGLFRSAYRIKLFLMLLIGAGLMVSLLGLIHYFFIYQDMIIGGLPEYIKHAVNLKRISSLFGWPNLLAGFLLLVIPLSFTGIFTFKNKGEKICMAAVSAVLLTAMFLTYSISSWVSLILGSAVIGFIFVKNKQGHEGKTRSKPITLFIAVAALLLFSLIILRRFDRFTSHSFTTRLEYLRVAAAMIKGRPFFGSGLNTFGRVDSYLASSPETFSNYVHNSYVQLFAETGAAGFLAFLGIMFYTLRYGIIQLGNIKGREERLLFIGIMWAITSFLIDNLFNCTILYAQTSTFWWVLLAVMFSSERFNTENVKE